MACGDRYRYLEVTESGYTRDNPYGTIPLFSDYEEWKELARELSLAANERFNELGQIETDKGGGSFPFWNQLVELNNAMTARYQGLPDVFTLSVPSEIEEAQRVIDEALCLMESADEGILYYTGEAPAPVRTRMRPWLKWTLIGASVVAVAAAGTAGALYYRKQRQRRRNPRRKNPRGKKVACGDLPARKCRQLQHVYESARDRGFSKERSAQQAWSAVEHSR